MKAPVKRIAADRVTRMVMRLKPCWRCCLPAGHFFTKHLSEDVFFSFPFLLEQKKRKRQSWTPAQVSGLLPLFNKTLDQRQGESGLTQKGRVCPGRVWKQRSWARFKSSTSKLAGFPLQHRKHRTPWAPLLPKPDQQCRLMHICVLVLGVFKPLVQN